MIFNTTTPTGNAGGAYKEVRLYRSAGIDDIQAWYLDENGEYQHYQIGADDFGDYIFLKVLTPSVFGVLIQNSEAQTSARYYVEGGELCSSSYMQPGKKITILATYHI